MSQLSKLLWQCGFLRGQQWQRLWWAVQVDRLSLSLSKGLPASCTTFFQKKKKQKKTKKKQKKTAIGQSKNPRTVSLEEKDSCGNMRQENAGEIDKRRASFTIFFKVENNSLELTRIFKESFRDQRWAWEESVRAEKRDRDAEREKETFRRQCHHQSISLDWWWRWRRNVSFSLSASLSLFSALTLSSHAHLWSLKLSSLFSAEQSVWTRPGPAPDAPSLTQTLIRQSV